jgi:hypothetical protein
MKIISTSFFVCFFIYIFCFRVIEHLSSSKENAHDEEFIHILICLAKNENKTLFQIPVLIKFLLVFFFFFFFFLCVLIFL